MLLCTNIDRERAKSLSLMAIFAHLKIMSKVQKWLKLKTIAKRKKGLVMYCYHLPKSWVGDSVTKQLIFNEKPLRIFLSILKGFSLWRRHQSKHLK